jgi:hypothetical protein
LEAALPLTVHHALKIADEVWIATALLHRECPDCIDFSIDEIVERVGREHLYGSVRPGVYVHVVQHCVANRPPNPARYRMLYETREGRRRLFRKGDPEHPERNGAKITPARTDLPESYAKLLAWYDEWCPVQATRAAKHDPLLSLMGSGRHVWGDEHTDEYVDRLRSGWK